MRQADKLPKMVEIPSSSTPLDWIYDEAIAFKSEANHMFLS